MLRDFDSRRCAKGSVAGFPHAAQIANLHLHSHRNLTAAIGANTTIFSLMNAVLLKSIDVPRADRLILLRVQARRLRIRL